MGVGLAKLSAEDPSFRVRTDEETGQTIIAGMGELHLEIIVDRLMREYKVEANQGRPQVAYRETIKGKARRARPTSGRPAARANTATANWRSRRSNRARATSSSEQDRRRLDPERIHRRRSRRARKRPWSAACWPATRWWTFESPSSTVRIHEVDSSEMAFKIAGSMTFKEAARKAQPIIEGADHGRRSRHAGSSTWAT